MAKYVFGIDLGTTYSCIAYVDETGRTTVIKNSEGTITTPSVVNFASPTQVVVGQIAKENAVIDPKNTATFVKRLMGKSNFAINYNGEDKSPEEVSAYILRKLASDASNMIDSQVKDVVITCPAYFGSAERTATKNAGIIAGLNVLEIISEPTAAALYYGCTKVQEVKTFLVYDLGGGTFDVTIMKISADNIEVICSDGDHELGGKDWDEAVMRFLKDEFVSETRFDGDFDEYSQQDLRLKAEKAKQQLSSKEEVPVMLDAAGLRAKINLSRTTFNDITSVLLNQTIEKTEATIAVAKDKGYIIDEIMLVGGATRMPQVTEALVAKYGIKPKILEPDEAVAKGAAIHAVNVYINHQKNLSEWEKKVSAGRASAEDRPDQLLLDKKAEYQEALKVDPTMMSIGGRMKEIIVATTKSFALKVIVNGKFQCCNMIVKNEPMPDGSVRVTRQFGTKDENQPTADLVVYESDIMDEYFDADEVYVLGTATMELAKNLPKGSPLEVTFTLNTEGILEVYGRDLTSNKEIRATMQAKGIMASEKVDGLREKSKNVVVM